MRMVKYQDDIFEQLYERDGNLRVVESVQIIARAMILSGILVFGLVIVGIKQVLNILF